MPKPGDHHLGEDEWVAIETVINQDNRSEVRLRCSAVRFLNL